MSAQVVSVEFYNPLFWRVFAFLRPGKSMLDITRCDAEPSEPDYHAIDREMRRVRPESGLRRNDVARTVRVVNQARFDASLRMRQRPNRVS